MKPSRLCYILSGGFLGAALTSFHPLPILLAILCAVIAIAFDAEDK